MKPILSLILTSLILCSCTHERSLKEIWSSKFYIGVALDSLQIEKASFIEDSLIKRHFNSIVAENCMKSVLLQPQENLFDFTLSDKLIAFGERNKMQVIGHCLIWHSQLPEWFCVDKQGNNVVPDTLKKRMRKHIQTVVSRYKNRVHGWDVVNEAFLDNGSWRESKFYEILGDEFLPLAFEYAHEADPHTELYYNDYAMSTPGKVAAVCVMIDALRQRGCRIDAVGMQAHLGLDYPSLQEFEAAIDSFAAHGVKVMITELDMTLLPFPQNIEQANVKQSVVYQEKMNPYRDGFPKEIVEKWNNRMYDFLTLFEQKHEVISRVTFWGLIDKKSWRMNWPIQGRNDYPLLFDNNYQPKKALQRILSIN